MESKTTYPTCVDSYSQSGSRVRGSPSGEDASWRCFLWRKSGKRNDEARNRREGTPTARKLMLRLGDRQRCAAGMAQGAAMTLAVWDHAPTPDMEPFGWRAYARTDDGCSPWKWRLDAWTILNEKPVFSGWWFSSPRRGFPLDSLVDGTTCMCVPSTVWLQLSSSFRPFFVPRKIISLLRVPSLKKSSPCFSKIPLAFLSPQAKKILPYLYGSPSLYICVRISKIPLRK